MNTSNNANHRRSSPTTNNNQNADTNSKHPIHTEAFCARTVNLHELISFAMDDAVQLTQPPPENGPLQDRFTDLSNANWTEDGAAVAVHIISEGILQILCEPQTPHFLEHLSEVVNARICLTPREMASTMLRRMGDIVRTHPNVSFWTRGHLDRLLNAIQELATHSTE